ncbi:MAG: type I glutamate--ammonia ligase [Candidatus Bathyarchaeia archaeon]
MSECYIEEKLKNENVKFISLHFPDVLGYLKGRTIPLESLSKVLKDGIGFDGSSIPGFTSIEDSDMVMKPDINTLVVFPIYNDKVARFICDIYKPNGERFEGDSRYVCQKVIEELKNEGFICNTGVELEFYTAKVNEKGDFEPVEAHIKDSSMYFDISPSRDMTEEFRKDFVLALLNTKRFAVEAFQHEVGSSQHEINFKFSDPLTTSDNILTYKFIAKEIAKKHGLIATFMPKPWFGKPGSGMHIHISLFYSDGENAFFDCKGYASLSEIGKYFIGGILAHSKALSAIVASTVNSYKRLTPGYEAPAYITWSRKNRSSLVRVPEYFPRKKDSVRIELRSPDPLCNPYLTFSAIIKAGLDGIKNRIEPPIPIEKDVFRLSENERKELGIEALPESLGEAIKELEEDNVIKEALGDYIFKKYIELKKKEWDEYRLRITPWEIEKYFFA